MATKKDGEFAELMIAILAQNERLHAIDKTLSVNTQHLEAHMARTTQIEQELMPVVKWRQQFVGASKLLGLLAVIATIATAALIFR